MRHRLSAACSCRIRPLTASTVSRRRVLGGRVQTELNRFHYDTAQVSLDGTLAALTKLVPISQIMYGTDFPYRTAVEHSKGVDALFDEDHRKRVNGENALSILPRLRGA